MTGAFWRRAWDVLGWAFLGTSLGAVISGLLWWIYLVNKGNSLWGGLQGEVEDGWGVLQGLLVLGCLIGVGVGLLCGLAKRL